MKKILFYSHDTNGLGNLRRALSICSSLREKCPDLSVLLISGSPNVHHFKIPKGIDYIKLPCLTRTEHRGYQAKFLHVEKDTLKQLRSDIIRCATANFKPDLIVVDNKPFGVNHELESALSFSRDNLPNTKIALVLRDILDSPDVTKGVWNNEKCHQAIEKFYDSILVLGLPEIFDPREEYSFPASTREMVRFCGYIQREPGRSSQKKVRTELGITKKEQLVLVTVGGGEDGLHLLETYLMGLRGLPKDSAIRTLMIYGPEMPLSHVEALSFMRTTDNSRVHLLKFTDDFMSYMEASDLVVSMGGSGTVCEIITLHKRAIVVPRLTPVGDQGIRAQRMARLGFFQTIHPKDLTPQTLIQAVVDQLSKGSYPLSSPPLDKSAFPKVTQVLSELMRTPAPGSSQFGPMQKEQRRPPRPSFIHSGVFGIHDTTTLSDLQGKPPIRGGKSPRGFRLVRMIRAVR